MIVAILYNIRSVHNVGSIFRTADGSGIDMLYLCGITPTPLTRLKKKRPDFIKTSLGAEDSISWEHYPEEKVLPLVYNLKERGFSIVCVEQTKESIPYTSYTPEKPLVFIVGNEIEGVPSRIQKEASRHIHIPMRSKKESLNVSVAFGIISYYLSS